MTNIILSVGSRSKVLILGCCCILPIFTADAQQKKVAGTMQPEWFTISARAGEHGTLSQKGEVSVPKNGNSLFSISADSGYYIDSVVVDGINQGTLTAYAFTNVSADHTIRTVFSKGQGPKKNDATSAQVGQFKSITAMGGKNGSVTPSGTMSVASHGTLEFTFKPEPGCEVDSVVVDGLNQGSITKYTFTNVMYDHSVYVTFVKGKK